MNQAVRVESLLQGSPAWYAKPESLTGDLVRMVDRERITVYQCEYLLLYHATSVHIYCFTLVSGAPRAGQCCMRTCIHLV